MIMLTANMSPASNAWTVSAGVTHTRRMITMWIRLAAFVLLVQASQCLPTDDRTDNAPVRVCTDSWSKDAVGCKSSASCCSERDSQFLLKNKATDLCLVKKTRCYDLRWTTGDRLFAPVGKKCLGAQGKSVGSEVNLYDCDENSELQKWECKNNTLLALKGQELYINIKAEDSVVLSKETGPNSEITIAGTSSGACTRTYRVLYTIEGNSFGKPCMFPFLYKDRWFSDCTTYDSSVRRNWCAVETKFDHQLWGYCPSTSTEHWKKNPISEAFYQINTQSALTWPEAQTSCKQQGASLLSVSDPHEQAYVSALVGTEHYKLWIGLVLDQEHGWQWTNGKPFRYLRWDAGYPLPNPGHNCAIVDSGTQFYWQSSFCSRKMGYICYKGGTLPPPVQVETGFCPSHWIPYNGHCFYLYREKKTWSQALTECRKEGGDLARVDNVEDKSFLVSQIGYAPATDELWIGLNDRKTEGLFDWSDHSTVTFTSWEFGEPTTSADQEDCVLMRGENGNWADRSCEEKHSFICMKMSDPTLPTHEEVPQDLGCKAGWKRHGSYCYFVGPEAKTFDEAKDTCKSSDSYLVDVSNAVDNAYLISLVGLRPEKYFWLGLSNQKNIDEFVWANTKPVAFTHWNSDMPGHQQGCVAMTTGVFAGLWDVLPCTNKEKYICKYLAEGAVVTPVPPTLTPPRCPDGWSPVGSRSFCAKFFTGPRSAEKTWYEARDYCRAIGGDLLSIHSAAELRVGGSTYGRAWIGLSAPDPVTGYVWSDGSPVNFLHWMGGEPNNKNNVESCAEYKLYNWDEDGSWNDVHCESFNDWLCQIRAGVNPKPPPNDTAPEYNMTADGWIVWRGNQYYINRRSMAMEDARHFCKERHGDLVVINSEAENVFLWKQISRNYDAYYIGLTVDLDETYSWMDGSPVVFQRWDEEQPDFKNNDENCVAMTYYTGFWRDYNCGWEHESICKRSISVPVNTTAAPTVPPKGGCPFGWTTFDSKCYSVITNVDTWEGSRKHCKAMGGNLVSILSRRVQVYLITLMPHTTDLWIGLNSLRGDEFYWTDGRPRRYTNWGYSKNRRRQGSYYQGWNEEECVVMSSNPSSGVGKWIIKSCNDTNGHICLRNVDPNIPASTDTTIVTTYVKVANDSIKIVTQNMTWSDAKKNCIADGAKLASVRNEWLQAYVELQSSNLKAPLWIGLNKGETGGYFKYIDGWHLSLVNWYPGEPRSDRSCVYVDVDGTWKTASCNRTMSSVCMQSTEVPPTESTHFPGVCPEDADVWYRDSSLPWQPFRSYCYLFVTDETGWADASSSCIRHGGMLASIEDPLEQQFIQSNVETFKESHSSFWIGLYKTHKGSWLWLDKKVMDYTNWDILEPDDDTYGEIVSSDGKWRTGRRWYDRAYICKTAKVPLQGPSPTGAHLILDPRSRAHASLAVVLVITIIAVLAGVAFYFYKKSGRPLPAFDNPLYRDSDRSQPDVVDTNKLIENAEEENHEPIITL